MKARNTGVRRHALHLVGELYEGQIAVGIIPAVKVALSTITAECLHGGGKEFSTDKTSLELSELTDGIIGVLMMDKYIRTLVRNNVITVSYWEGRRTIVLNQALLTGSIIPIVSWDDMHLDLHREAGLLFILSLMLHNATVNAGEKDLGFYSDMDFIHSLPEKAGLTLRGLRKILCRLREMGVIAPCCSFPRHSTRRVEVVPTRFTPALRAAYTKRFHTLGVRGPNSRRTAKSEICEGFLHYAEIDNKLRFHPENGSSPFEVKHGEIYGFRVEGELVRARVYFIQKQWYIPDLPMPNSDEIPAIRFERQKDYRKVFKENNLQSVHL